MASTGPSTNSTGSATTPSPTAAIALPSLDDTFGALLIGTYFALVLYGINLLQAYRYSRKYGNDPVFLKILVVVVMVFETFNTLLTAHFCYYYLATSYFQPTKLLFGVWSICLLPLSLGLVIISSQSFFVRRVMLLGHKYRPIAILALLFFFGELGMYSAATAKAFLFPTFAEFSTVTWLLSAGAAMAVTGDILLTAVLILVLHKSRTGIKTTDSTIDILIMYSINTGLVTGIFNILAFIFSLILPDNQVYTAIGIVGSKLYTCTLFAALNARQALAARGRGTFGTADAGRFPSSQQRSGVHITVAQRTTVDGPNVLPTPLAFNSSIHSTTTVLDIKEGTELTEMTDMSSGDNKHHRRGELSV